MVRSLSQLRAEHAFRALAQDGGSRELAEGLGTMLRQNGLLATWAFALKPKKRATYRPILWALRRHLQSRHPDLFRGDGNADEAEVYRRWVANGPTGLRGAELRRLTAEALACAEWFKRAAQALEGS